MSGWTYTVTPDAGQVRIDSAADQTASHGIHGRDECDATFWCEFVVAVYGAHGELLFGSWAQSCGERESVLDPQRFADESAPLWPGREVCVWSDLSTVPAQRRSQTPTPDATARTS